MGYFRLVLIPILHVQTDHLSFVSDKEIPKSDTTIQWGERVLCTCPLASCFHHGLRVHARSCTRCRGQQLCRSMLGTACGGPRWSDKVQSWSLCCFLCGASIHFLFVRAVEEDPACSCSTLMFGTVSSDLISLPKFQFTHVLCLCFLSQPVVQLYLFT